ncbi:ATP-binding cassette domain-containing protein [Devosia sp. 1635]|uniref:ABC transporter ATP-binding protein n=1 Tax=Devosia sp. 1635 TaxID=2726066 RepID=UPI001566AC17|nr:ATP-binding cassette domain-containing protein [Devosia sp. 1635]
MAAIVAEHASKTFQQVVRRTGRGAGLRDFLRPQRKDVPAVQNISFSIEAGEAVGYLGPNGAGKSTMIKMLTGILTPSSGRVDVLGRDPVSHRITNALEIGVVFGQRSQLWWELPVQDSFNLHGRIYGVEPARLRGNQDRLIEMLEIGAFIDRPVRQLSLGQRMRAELALALLHDPKILFLDEPTIGLDVVAKEVVRRFLATINREAGVTIILTTHDLKDIERICPRLIMVDEGQLLYDGRTDKLRQRFGTRRQLQLTFAADPGALVLSGAEPLTSTGAVRDFLVTDPDRSLVDFVTGLGSTTGLVDAHMREPDIEEVIRTYFEGRRP